MSKQELELPKGWVETKIGDIITSVKGKKPKTLVKTISKNNFPYINIKAFEKKIFDEFTNDESCPRCTENDLLMVWDGSRSGLVGFGVSGVIGSTISKIDCHKNNSKFLWYFLYSKYQILNTKQRGTGTPHVNPDILMNFKFLLPSLKEQKRIVSKIEELFSLVEKILFILKDVEKQIEHQRISLIHWIFFGNFKNNNYPSSDWETGRIVDFFDIVGGGTPSTKNSKYWNGKTPWITSADIHGIRDIRPRRTVSELGIEKSSTHKIPKNSILIVTRVGLGKLAILDIPMCINQDIQGLITKKSDIIPSFALHYLSETIQIFKYENRGTTIAGVTKKQLADLPFVIPSSSEQIEISNFIDSQISILSKLKENSESLTKFTKNLKSIILKQAFEGKLVPQDPNDEPASELLKRIKSSRGVGCQFLSET